MLALLGVLLVLCLALLLKLSAEQWVRLAQGRGGLLGGLAFLTGLLMAIALLPGQAWAADLVKVALGAFVGAGAASLYARPVVQQAAPAAPPLPVPNPASTHAPAAELDHELHFISNRRNPAQEIQNVTEEALRQGWNLTALEAGAAHFDGVILVFTRPAQGARTLRFSVDGQVQQVPLV